MTRPLSLAAAFLALAAGGCGQQPAASDDVADRPATNSAADRPATNSASGQPASNSADSGQPSGQPVSTSAADRPASASAAAPRPVCAAGRDDCFKYWTVCGLLFASVGVSEDSPVTADRVRNAVESRLRAARILWTAGASLGNVGFLNVYLTSVFGSGAARVVGASMLDIRLTKRMRDLASGVATFAAARAPVAATVFLHNRASAEQQVMNTVSAALDEFINNYLRVNEPACRELGR